MTTLDNNPIELIKLINGMKCSEVPEEIKKSIPLLYSTSLQLLNIIKPSPELKEFSDGLNEHIKKYEEKKNEKKEDGDFDQMEQLKKIFEPFKDVKEVTDELVNTICETMIIPIQSMFYNMFNDESESGPKFIDLSNIDLNLKIKEFIKKTKESPVCQKYHDYKNDMDEFENKESINVFDMMQMILCKKCLHLEDDHQVCSFFKSTVSEFETKYTCITCGCNSSKHETCDNFMSESDNFCIHCGMDYYNHEKKLKENSYPCQNYVNIGTKICQVCKFSDQDHLNSTTYNLLPDKLRGDIGDLYFCFSMPLMVSQNMDLLVANEFLMQMNF